MGSVLLTSASLWRPRGTAREPAGPGRGPETCREAQRDLRSRHPLAGRVSRVSEPSSPRLLGGLRGTRVALCLSGRTLAHLACSRVSVVPTRVYLTCFLSALSEGGERDAGWERRGGRPGALCPGARAGPAHPGSLLRGWELGRQLCTGRGSEGPEQAGREGLPLRRVRVSVCERSPLMLAACIFVGL